jgi:hypothetical protein
MSIPLGHLSERLKSDILVHERPSMVSSAGSSGIPIFNDSKFVKLLAGFLVDVKNGLVRLFLPTPM